MMAVPTTRAADATGGLQSPDFRSADRHDWMLIGRSDAKGASLASARPPLKGTSVRKWD
jgi:hypothetical protein